MTVAQLRETTMNVDTRVLVNIKMKDDMIELSEQVDRLMGKNPEERFIFIQEQALKKRESLGNILDI